MYLKLNGLSKKFEDKYAVKDLNISIIKGELVSLLGPSGCGKTTTLKMIGGFIKPTYGKIILDDVDITDLGPENRSVATVFQSYALFPHMNVIQNVGYGLKYKREYSKKQAKLRAEEMLEIVGLSEYAFQNVTKLSGGQQQRVALARALILNPKILLLDEPFSNLDAKLRLRMRKEIKDLQKRFDITMIFVTHDQEEALSISDRIVVMNKGSVEQTGKPKEVYEKPNSQFVADFIGRANIINNDDKLLIVRPENITIDDENGDYKGEIIQKQFMGPYTSYFIKIDDEIFQADISSRYDKDWELKDIVWIKLLEKKQVII